MAKQTQKSVFEGLPGFELYTFQGRGQMSPDFVLFAPKTMTLCFSAILEEKLGMRDWETCLLAFNQKTKAIALKQCEPEEYGCRRFNAINKESSSRRLVVKGMIKFFDASDDVVRKYRPEKRADNLVVLNPVDEETA